MRQRKGKGEANLSGRGYRGRRSKFVSVQKSAAAFTEEMIKIMGRDQTN